MDPPKQTAIIQGKVAWLNLSSWLEIASPLFSIYLNPPPSEAGSFTLLHEPSLIEPSH
jgi:hypothetical protein